jgi:hypothetical protein
MCSTKKPLWIHEDDVPWLVTYIADELGTGGVGPIEDAAGDMEEEGQEENQELLIQGAAVAAPSLLDPVTPVKVKKAAGKVRWDFNGAWEAVIKEGPQKGTKVTCVVNALTAAKWAVVSNLHQYPVDFENSTFQERKTAARHFLEQHLETLQVQVHEE